MRISIPVVGVLLSVAALGLSGCSSAETANNSSQLDVVATTTQVGDFTSEVGGESIHLRTLLSAGASAHAFEPTQADMVALAEADVLVINGLNLETFIDDAIETSGFSGSIIDAGEGLALEDPHSEDEVAGDEHDHGDINPHIWTAPTQAADMVATIASGLAKAAPEHREVFEQNAAAYTLKLDALDTWIAENMAQVPAEERLFVSGHNSLDYYLDAYDITYVGSILPSFEDNARPSVAEVNQLIDAMNELGVKAIFVESSMNPKIASRIAEQTGAVVIDQDVIYADSLGAQGSGAETYIDATIHNTRAILTAWGYEPTPIPKELQ